MNKIGLYIHIPFCDGKCPYCDFYSVRADSAAMDKYISQVIRRLEKYCGDNILFDTVYLGGGTPSLLGTDRLKKLLNGISQKLQIDKEAEITMEVNPKSALTLDLKELNSCGLNRLSIGLQSAVAEELALLGRKHSAQDVASAVKKANQAGIDNISLDLMIGIPEQTEKNIKFSADYCKSLGVKHISAYILKFEKGTPFYRNIHNMKIKSDDEQANQYLFTANYLESLGYKQYEISNFSLEGYQSRHNNKYWRCMEYIGIGPSAHSFYQGKRFYYDRSFESFYKDKTVFDGTGGDEEEFIMLNLRLTNGLIFKEFENRYRILPEKFYKKCILLQKSGYTVFENERVYLTKKGFLLSNSIIAELLNSL